MDKDLRNTILRLEKLSINAWPALQTVAHDSWVLRCADGYTRRANSVQIFSPSERPLDEKIAFCEAFYGDRGLPTVFKMTAASLPEDLDAQLEARGYRREAETSVQTLDLAQKASLLLSPPAPPTDPMVTFDSSLSDAWLQAFCAYNQIAPKYHSPMQRMLERLLPNRCFASLTIAGEISALGLAVREQSYVGLFDIVTAPTFRRQGWGHRLVTELLDWGRRGGAQRAYLQVMKDNSEAERLYARIGFTERYTYWYRVKPSVRP